MWSRCLFVSLMVMLATSAFPVAAAVDDQKLDEAATAYRKLFNDSREAGNRPGMADMGDYVDEAFKGIPIDLDQVQKVVDSVPAANSTRTAAALNALLKSKAAGVDADAGRAAILRLRVQPPTAKSEERLPRIKEALSHPGIKDAVAAGYGADVFATATSLAPADLAQITDQLVALKDSIRPTAPATFFNAASGFIMRTVSAKDPATAKAYGALREALASALAEKLKGPVDEKDQKRLSDALARLNGAWARGELVGHPAPTIQFDWFRDPANPERQIRSLDDLKGKVVVLDFWATWCGPCIASFPKVKAVHNYYRGYDVVVIGVTSPQGYHVANGQRIDTKDNPQKEFELMPSFMDEKTMTWPVAFSKQPVFNPDYGVTGIPSMVIIDAKGIVRHAGLHPGSDLDSKITLIDPLLAEAGLVLPARLMVPGKPE